MLKKHTPLVGYMMHKKFKYLSREMNDEYHQSGMEGLLRAIRTYDPLKAKFSTYATTCIYRAIERFIQSNPIVRLPYNKYRTGELIPTISPLKDCIKDELDFEDLNMDIKNILNRREYSIFVRYYKYGFTIANIAAMNKVSRSTAYKFLKLSENKIRKYYGKKENT